MYTLTMFLSFNSATLYRTVTLMTAQFKYIHMCCIGVCAAQLWDAEDQCQASLQLWFSTRCQETLPHAPQKDSLQHQHMRSAKQLTAKRTRERKAGFFFLNVGLIVITAFTNTWGHWDPNHGNVLNPSCLLFVCWIIWVNRIISFWIWHLRLHEKLQKSNTLRYRW